MRSWVTIVAVTALVGVSGCLSGRRSLADHETTSRVTLDVTTPLVIGFSSPLTAAEMQNDNSGAREGLAHVRFALEDIGSCHGDSSVVYRIEEAVELVLRDSGKVWRIPISRNDGRAVGILFVAPGRAPRVVLASAGPSSLRHLGPQGAFAYFGAEGCRPR